ncbi:MAG: hypothetical protein AAF702_11880 [Chloroflexota bacterium]
MLTNNDTKTTNQPSHLLYDIEDSSKSDKTYWTRIGAMWPHKDGKGFNIQLKFLPVSGGGKLVIREYEPKEKDADGESDTEVPPSDTDTSDLSDINGVMDEQVQTI